MSYLDRLKQLESGEIFHNTPEHEPTEPTKGASDGFVGSIPGAYEKIHTENDAAETGDKEGLIFQKVTRPLPTEPTKGIDSAERIKRMTAQLESDPGLRYAMETNNNAEPEAVILTLAIRGKGACELRIPKSHYDGIALLELIEKYTTQETLQ